VFRLEEGNYRNTSMRKCDLEYAESSMAAGDRAEYRAGTGHQCFQSQWIVFDINGRGRTPDSVDDIDPHITNRSVAEHNWLLSDPCAVKGYGSSDVALGCLAISSVAVKWGKLAQPYGGTTDTCQQFAVYYHLSTGGMLRRTRCFVRSRPQSSISTYVYCTYLYYQ
jgi:hypothetical protein